MQRRPPTIPSKPRPERIGIWICHILKGVDIHPIHGNAIRMEEVEVLLKKYLALWKYQPDQDGFVLLTIRDGVPTFSPLDAAYLKSLRTACSG